MPLFYAKATQEEDVGHNEVRKKAPFYLLKSFTDPQRKSKPSPKKQKWSGLNISGINKFPESELAIFSTKKSPKPFKHRKYFNFKSQKRKTHIFGNENHSKNIAVNDTEECMNEISNENDSKLEEDVNKELLDCDPEGDQNQNSQGGEAKDCLAKSQDPYFILISSKKNANKSNLSLEKLYKKLLETNTGVKKTIDEYYKDYNSRQREAYSLTNCSILDTRMSFESIEPIRSYNSLNLDEERPSMINTMPTVTSLNEPFDNFKTPPKQPIKEVYLQKPSSSKENCRRKTQFKLKGKNLYFEFSPQDLDKNISSKQNYAFPQFRRNSNLLERLERISSAMKKNSLNDSLKNCSSSSDQFKPFDRALGISLLTEKGKSPYKTYLNMNKTFFPVTNSSTGFFNEDEKENHASVSRSKTTVEKFIAIQKNSQSPPSTKPLKSPLSMERFMIPRLQS